MKKNFVWIVGAVLSLTLKLSIVAWAAGGTQPSETGFFTNQLGRLQKLYESTSKLYDQAGEGIYGSYEAGKKYYVDGTEERVLKFIRDSIEVPFAEIVSGIAGRVNMADKSAASYLERSKVGTGEDSLRSYESLYMAYIGARNNTAKLGLVRTWLDEIPASGLVLFLSVGVERIKDAEIEAKVDHRSPDRPANEKKFFDIVLQTYLNKMVSAEPAKRQEAAAQAEKEEAKRIARERQGETNAVESAQP